MRKEIMSFYGTDRNGAWEEAFRLSDLLVARGAADRMKVRVERIRGEWVVTLTHLERDKSRK